MPFGLTFNPYQKDPPENYYKFQGQEHQPETGWDQYKWRNADPSIGRFFNVDPLAEKFYYNSTYAFSENRVIDGVELEGLEYVPAELIYHTVRTNSSHEEAKKVVNSYRESYKSLFMNTELQWKLGFGKTLGLHLEYAGLGFDAFKDWGTYSVGHNSMDGSINEWSKGQG